MLYQVRGEIVTFPTGLGTLIAKEGILDRVFRAPRGGAGQARNRNRLIRRRHARREQSDPRPARPARKRHSIANAIGATGFLNAHEPW